jgi:hypothetical protein
MFMAVIARLELVIVGSKNAAADSMQVTGMLLVGRVIQSLVSLIQRSVPRTLC